MFTATLNARRTNRPCTDSTRKGSGRRRSCAIQTNTSGCGYISVSEVFFNGDRSLSYVFDS